MPPSPVFLSAFLSFKLPLRNLLSYKNLVGFFVSVCFCLFICLFLAPHSCLKPFHQVCHCNTPLLVLISILGFSIAVINTENKGNLKRKVCVSSDSLQSTMKGNQGRNSRQQSEGRNWNRDQQCLVAYSPGLAQFAFFYVCGLSVQRWHCALWGGPSCVNHQLRKCPTYLPVDQSDEDFFSSWGSLFPNDSNLYQLNKKLTNEIYNHLCLKYLNTQEAFYSQLRFPLSRQLQLCQVNKNITSTTYNHVCSKHFEHTIKVD